MANWGNLPIDLATKIVEHADLFEDFETFRFVSSHWRSAAKQAKFRSTVNVPWVMLPKDDNSSTRRSFYSLSSHRVRHIDLPSSSPDGFEDDTRLLSSHGWLLSVSNRCKNLSLLNPLSGSVTQLPRVRFYCRVSGHDVIRHYSYESTMFRKFILSANPSKTSAFSIALILREPYENLCCWHNVIVFWNNDDDQWVPLSGRRSASSEIDGHILYNCHDICFYQCNFYAADSCGNVLRFDLNQAREIPRVVQVLKPVLDCYIPIFYYLVEFGGQLLRVSRVKRKGNDCYTTISFEILELNLDDGTTKKVHDLGSSSLFVGSNSSFSVEDATKYGCKTNCIYYTDESQYDDFYPYLKSKGDDIGVYNLTNGEIERFYEGTPSNNKFTPFMWVEPPIAFDYDS